MATSGVCDYFRTPQIHELTSQLAYVAFLVRVEPGGVFVDLAEQDTHGDLTTDNFISYRSVLHNPRETSKIFNAKLCESPMRKKLRQEKERAYSGLLEVNNFNAESSWSKNDSKKTIAKFLTFD
jgi:hypothetical protein